MGKYRALKTSTSKNRGAGLVVPLNPPLILAYNVILFYPKTLYLTYFTCGDLIHVVGLYKETHKMGML